MEEPHTGTHSMGNAQFCPEIGLYLSLLDINIPPPHTHTQTLVRDIPYCVSCV